MKTSTDGIRFIKRQEGTRYAAYKDSVGIWTIGCGHTGKDVKEGLTIDDAEVERLLSNDLEWAENGVNGYVDVPVEQHQFDALVSLTFNIGGTAFRGSTLCRLLNAGNYDACAKQFLRWDKAGGKVLPGLSRRRKEEERLFSTGVYQ